MKTWKVGDYFDGYCDDTFFIVSYNNKIEYNYEVYSFKLKGTRYYQLDSFPEREYKGNVLNPMLRLVLNINCKEIETLLESKSNTNTLRGNI
jgi:hypothetical protein